MLRMGSVILVRETLAAFRSATARPCGSSGRQASCEPSVPVLFDTTQLRFWWLPGAIQGGVVHDKLVPLLRQVLPAELVWEIDRVHMRNRLPIFSSTRVGKDWYGEGEIGEPIP